MIVLVGSDPGVGDEPLPGSSRSDRRLADLMGLPPDDYDEATDRVNLQTAFDGLAFEPWEDELAARNLAPLLRGRRVVLLGRRVARAFGAGDAPWAEWRLGSSFVYAVLPHPSGRSRWWNDPINEARAREFMRCATRPCVHVEGTDGSGKSTLVPKIAEAMALDVVPTDGPPRTAEEMIDRASTRIVSGTVCDRSSGLVSEMVYGPVLRGGYVRDDQEKLVRSVARAATFVYCRPPIEVAWEGNRPRDGEDPAHLAAVKERFRELYDRYDVVMALLETWGARVVRYDWTRDSVNELMRRLTCAV